MNLSTPIHASSLADQAFERVANAIVRGELAPGERISEVQVARHIGISRGPLREALIRLEGRGLVIRRNNFGVSVVSLSAKDLDELLTVREALEGMACRLAATEMTDAEIADLEDLLERHGSSRGVREGTSYYQESLDEDFHFRVVRCSRNARLIRSLCDDLYYQTRVYRYRSSTHSGRAPQAFDEHCRIVEALRSRSPERAEAAMRHHLMNARLNLTLNVGAEMRPRVPEFPVSNPDVR